MPVYRPNARVKLALRLDEGGETAELDARLPSSSAPAGVTSPSSRTPTALQGQVSHQLEENQADLEDLASRRGELDAPEFTYRWRRLEEERAELQATFARLPGVNPPDALGGAPPDNNVVLGSILPASAEIFRNGIRLADRARVTINYRDAPFDPRLIRACGIEIVLGLVSAEDFQRGMRGGVYDGDSYALVERTLIGTPEAPGTTRFVGYVDEWKVNLDGQDGDTIELICRDLTAPLIDQKMPQGTSIDLDLQLAHGISDLLNSFPSTQGMSVVFDPGEGLDDGPIPGEAIPRSRRARRGASARRSRSGGNNLNLWDHITDVCNQLGFVPLVDNETLRIIEPRTFYAGSEDLERWSTGGISRR